MFKKNKKAIDIKTICMISYNSRQLDKQQECNLDNGIKLKNWR